MSDDTVIIEVDGKEVEAKKGEMRVLPAHYYGGPQGLGDPNYRGLSKMEKDPLVTSRCKEIARMMVCVEAYLGPIAGGEGVKLEDQILVTESGREVLSALPFEEGLL